jgi:oligopeptidase B
MPGTQRLRLSLLISLILALPHLGAAQEPAVAKPKPPVARKKPHVLTTHGDKRVDNYFWLRDKKDPEVLAHLEAENAYTESMMKGTEALQEKLYDELRGHMTESDFELPVRRGEYFYYSRTEEGKQYPIDARKKGSLDAPEEVTLDVNVLAKGLQFIDVGDRAVSEDGNLLAYTTDTTGSSQYTLFIKDLRTGELLPDRIEHVADVLWASDNKTLFYVTYDNVAMRPDKFFRHVLGSATDDLLFEEQDELFRLRASRTRDRALILLDSYSKTTTDIRFIPSNEPAGVLRVITPRKAGHTSVVEHRGDELYIRTNDRAPNYRLVKVKDSNPSMEQWEELIPARPDVELFEVNVFENHMAASEVRDGNRAIRIIDLRTGVSTPITFDEAVYNLSRDWNEFDTTKFRYRYNSLLELEAIFDYDMEKRVNTLVKRNQVPNYDASLYASERAYATASDGTRIPLDIVYRKPFVRNGKRPMLLYSYGSSGWQSTPISSRPIICFRC